MSEFETVSAKLTSSPKKWLITGVAGFIGSNLLETLLKLGQIVVGLDNFATGHQRNLDEVKSTVSGEQWSNFSFIEGDIRDYHTCEKAVENVDYVLHQAALGSVPRSIADPLTSNATNVSGFLNMLQASKEANVDSFTYAASSSTYGDHPALPKVEQNIGNPLSPYAVTKYLNELYANVYARTYGFKSIGLRYFNVFGYRQDPNGAYAAVIPKWVNAMLTQQTVTINGDGETSRDFCFIDNVVQANILAATSTEEAKGEIYNVALGDRTSLKELFAYIKVAIEEKTSLDIPMPEFKDFRAGDVKHSLADISKAKNLLGYEPSIRIKEGIKLSVASYMEAKSK